MPQNFSLQNLRGRSFRGQNLEGADFSHADLRNADFSDAVLRGTNFRHANLSKVNFVKAELSGADLRSANLSNSDFTKADLQDTIINRKTVIANKWRLVREIVSNRIERRNLMGANLSDADLSGAYLGEANLAGANLSNSDLYSTYLSFANLTGANLTGSELIQTDFTEADLTGVALGRTYLHQTYFQYANLSKVDLSNANLRWVDFSDAILVGIDLTNSTLYRVSAFGANFCDAVFTGACIEDWNINTETNLEGIVCDYIHLKENKQERRPSSGEFAPGEFTKLFQKILETVDLIFVDGIDWKAFLKSFQELQIQYGDIAVQAIEKKSGGAFVIRLEVPQEASKAEIERQAKQLYELELNKLEEIYREKLKAKDGEVEIYRHQNTELLEIIKLQANKPIKVEAKAVAGDDIRQSGNFGIGVNKGEVNTEKIAGTINESQKQTLAETAAEIQALLEQLDKTHSTDTTTGKMALAAEAIARIENNPTLTARILSALKVGSLKALEQFLSHPAASFIVGALEDWQNTSN